MEDKMKAKCILENNKGAVLVTAMLVLVLLTLMGKSITTLSTNEMKIAGNERFEKKTFFASEAGFGHIEAMLQSEFTNRNQAKIASGQSPDWDFSLNGTVAGINAATSADFDGGAVWIDDCPLNDGARLSCNYTVTVWNNPDDGGGPTDDTDQLLCVRSVATGPRKTKSSVDITLLGQASGDAITGYFAQNGGGAGNNNSIDVNAISDFAVQ
jgi:hypothetical protein